MKHTGLAVIESNWLRKQNISVRGLFDLVANIACENPNAYHYEMANSEAGLKEAIPRIGAYPECRYLCLAMHGDFDGLQTLSGQRLSRTELRNLLSQIKDTDRSKLRGLHLGSCLFASERLAAFLFEREIGVHWIAGYSKEVDWLDSSAMDLLFLNELLNHNDMTEIQRIEGTASRLLDIAAGLVRDLGFGIFVRKRRTGGIKNLLTSAYLEEE
ncbi:hypothetical protein [Microbaculum marinum]|uniref:Uncharacterized protein n=1 Tax=Microbaculum marinum TaxID=1764581 RepID=A0AAW9RKN0_9HYPH